MFRRRQTLPLTTNDSEDDISDGERNSNGQRGKWFAHERQMVELLLGFDFRSLALFRIMTAILIIVDLCVRLGDFNAHYSMNGMVTRSYSLRYEYYIYIHAWLPSDTFTLFVFLCNLVAAMMLLIGYRTQISVLLCWLFMTSLHNRQPFVNNAGDTLLRLQLFWSIFLPLGACFSFDRAAEAARLVDGRSRNSNTQSHHSYHLSLASVGFILQLFIMYWVTAARKSHHMWDDGTATYYALSIAAFATPVGEYLLFHLPSSMLLFLTKATLYFEYLGPMLALMPVSPTVAAAGRMAAVVGFAGMHLAFGSCLRIGLFMAVPIAAWCVFIPREVWDWLIDKVRRRWQHRAVVIDVGDSPSCRRWRRWLAAFAAVCLFPETHFMEESQRDTSYGPTRVDNDPLNMSTTEFTVHDVDGNKHYGTAAVVRLLAAAPLLWPLLGWIVPVAGERTVQRMLAWSGRLVDAIAKKTKRHWPGRKLATPRLPRLPNAIQRNSLRTLQLACIVYVLMHNLGHFYDTPHRLTRMRWVVPVMVQLLRMEQTWNMFAPNPPTSSSWYVVEGDVHQGAGKVVVFPEQRLLRQDEDGEQLFARPQSVAGEYRNQRWRKYYSVLESAGLEGSREILSMFGEYVCRTSFAGGVEREPARMLDNVRLWFMQVATAPFDQRPNSPADLPRKANPILLWQQSCPR